MIATKRCKTCGTRLRFADIKGICVWVHTNREFGSKCKAMKANAAKASAGKK
jgi:hypothetical protein